MLTRGSFDDMEKLGVEPREGRRFTFYDQDADDQNRPIFLCAEGVLHFDREAKRWIAAIDEQTVRVVPKTQI